MAAPSATARSTPGGKWLKSGHPTKITISLDPDISFWEKAVKTFGRTNGDKIETTTMFNTRRRTFAPRPLIEYTDVEATCAYDPAVATQLDAILGVEGTVTVTHPDGSTEAAFGYLMSWEPDENSEGEQPTASVVFVVTSWDDSADVEAGPTLVSVSGT
jgi:hypothetical protein